MRISTLLILTVAIPSSALSQAMPGIVAARGGDVVIVCRHAATDPADEDEQTLQYDDPATQRRLSAEGERQAAALGRAFRALRIPMSEVIASPMQRARRTAELAFGEVRIDSLWHTRGENYGGPRLRARAAVLAHRPDRGARIIVSHIGTIYSNLPSITGELDEGDCVVVRPEGPLGYRVIQVVPWEAWIRAGGDAAALDSVPWDNPHHGGIFVFFAGATVAMLAAPVTVPLLVSMRDSTQPDSIPPRVADDHVTLYQTGGFIAGRHGRVSDGWSYSTNLELLVRGIWSEIRLERFNGREDVRFTTVRAGYLWRTRTGWGRGGFTLGFRSPSSSTSDRSFEIGLPVVGSNDRYGARFAPTYVISSRGVSWNYHLQLDVAVSDGFRAGFALEAKPPRQHAPYMTAVALLVGWRL